MNSVFDEKREQKLFDSVTEKEIIYLWRSIKGRGLSENEAWNILLTGFALDIAFAKSKTSKEIEH